MELICEKYKERMEASKAACRHPKEYCKFRSSCMISFLSGEQAGEDNGLSERKRKDQSANAAD